MPVVNQNERQQRLEAVEDVIGSHRAEGIQIDGTVEQLMTQFVAGELSLDQFSAAVDRHAAAILPAAPTLAGAA